MDQRGGSLRSGTESMTMITTMIWEAQAKGQNMIALFLVDQMSIPIPDEGKRVENQQKKVRNINNIHFSVVKSCFDKSKLVVLEFQMA
jgi:hypothetical protein